MNSSLKLKASIMPNDTNARDRRHANIHFYILTGDLRQFAEVGDVPLDLKRVGVNIILELAFSVSGYNATFVDRYIEPEPLCKELKVHKPITSMQEFDYTLKAGYSSFKDSNINSGLIQALEFRVRIDNIWADVKHGILAMPAYLIMLRLNDLRINGRSYIANCETSIVIHYVGIRYRIEWVDSKNPSSIKTWSSRYSVVEDIGAQDIYCQFSPVYRVDEILALVFELVIGGVFGGLLTLFTIVPNMFVQWLSILIVMFVIMIFAAIYIYFSLGRYRLGRRILNLNARTNVNN